MSSVSQSGRKETKERSKQNRQFTFNAIDSAAYTSIPTLKSEGYSVNLRRPVHV